MSGSAHFMPAPVPEDGDQQRRQVTMAGTDSTGRHIFQILGDLLSHYPFSYIFSLGNSLLLFLHWFYHYCYLTGYIATYK